MKLIIEGRAEEIAALAAELQGRPEKMIHIRSKPCTREERKQLTDTIRKVLENQNQDMHSKQQPDPTSQEQMQVEALHSEKPDS